MGQNSSGQTSAATYHKGDLLAGLWLPVDHVNTAAEEEQKHGQRCQDPHFHANDGAVVVCGEIAGHAHQ